MTGRNKKVFLTVVSYIKVFITCIAFNDCMLSSLRQQLSCAITNFVMAHLLKQ